MATLRFHIAPNARIDKVIGEHGSAIKIKLRAPPVEGKANAALRTFLSERLAIPERNIVIEHGHKSRTKLVRFEGISGAEVKCRLLATL
jgi:uncharacterized protein